MSQKVCMRCKTVDGDLWWKCCPRHTQEQIEADIMCDSCVRVLHPEYFDKESLVHKNIFEENNNERTSEF